MVAGAATQEELSLQGKERKLFGAGKEFSPRSMEQRAVSSHSLCRGHLVAGGAGLVEQVYGTLEA